MKSLFQTIVFLSVIALLVTECNKESSHSTSGKTQLTLSKSTVARGEQLIVSTQPASSSTIVKFTVFPSSGTKLFTSKDQATALFGNSGKYTVTANYYIDSAGSPFDSSSSPVVVSDSIYTPPPVIPSDTSALAGNDVNIQPITASDTGGLILVAQTSLQYSCYPQLNYYFDQWGNNFELAFQCVSSTPGPCNGVMNTAKAYIFAQAPANGTYNFDVILNTVTYHGTLTVTDQKYTFNWPYSSGVTISPLQIDTK